jgi:probable rRNA maturation factor
MINFHDLGTDSKLDRRRELKSWLNKVAKTEKKKIGQLDIIFCTDDYLLDLNRKHLNHDYYTDIITFNYSDNQTHISGDLYISLDRVNENARTFGSTGEEEIKRVIVHGLLHLIGYDDTNDEKKRMMKEKEDLYLGL